MNKIVFTGGGTLGHVMPNLYLIDSLIEKNEVAYIGSGGIEKSKIKSEGIEFYEIPAIKLVRGKILTNLKIPFVLLSSIFKAKKILSKIKPTVVFSKGGYVALPVCIAARMLKISIVAHESDYSFGLANKLILKLCSKMCVNFQHLEKLNKKIIYTGPIFSSDFDGNHKNTNFNLENNKPTILIVGGSLGSKVINDNLFPIIKDIIKKYNIIHITGKGNLKVKSFENYNAIEQTNDMVGIYNLADFVIGRSGAGVTAECFYKRIPMLLIPLENGVSRGDQLQNAKYYENLGVAKILREENLTPSKLEQAIYSFDFINKKNHYQNIKIDNGRNNVLKIIEEYLK